MATLEQLRQVKRKHSANLLRQEGVCGVDIDLKKSGEGVIVVHLETRNAKVRQTLPTELEGIPVEYVYTGPIRKQVSKKQAPRVARTATSRP